MRGLAIERTIDAVRRYPIPISFWASHLRMSTRQAEVLVDRVRRGSKQGQNFYSTAGFTLMEGAASAWLARHYPPPPPMVLEMRRARGRYPDCTRARD